MVFFPSKSARDAVVSAAVEQQSEEFGRYETSAVLKNGSVATVRRSRRNAAKTSPAGDDARDAGDEDTSTGLPGAANATAAASSSGGGSDVDDLCSAFRRTLCIDESTMESTAMKTARISPVPSRGRCVDSVQTTSGGRATPVRRPGRNL